MIYKFNNDSKSKDVYAIWSPTSNNITVDDYSFAIGEADDITLVTLSEGEVEGVQHKLTADAGKVSVDVSERPVFIVVEHEQELVPGTDPPTSPTPATLPAPQPADSRFVTAGSEVSDAWLRKAWSDHNDI